MTGIRTWRKLILWDEDTLHKTHLQTTDIDCYLQKNILRAVSQIVSDSVSKNVI